MLNSFFFHDRINIIADQIGINGILSLLETVKSCGVNCVGINQHDNGGFWAPKYVALVKQALAKCRELDMKVIWFVDDISKADHGSPAGWIVEPIRHHPLIKPAREQLTQTRQLEFRFLLRKGGLYELEYEASDAVACFLIKDNFSPEWQMSRFPTAQSGLLEFPAMESGYYRLVLRGPQSFTAKIQTLRALDPYDANGEVKTQNYEDYTTFEYIGAGGLSGHFFSRTPDFSDRAFRLSVLGQAYSNLLNWYMDDVDIFHGVFIGGDEFVACGDGYSWGDMLEDIKRHEAAATALGLKLYQWVRPGDYRNPSRSNLKGSLDDALHDLFFNLTNHIPIGWADKTNDRIAQDTKTSLGDRAVAGVYLLESTPEHFKNAGFTGFSAFWWPKTGQTWADFPDEALRHTATVFQG